MLTAMTLGFMYL